MNEVKGDSDRSEGQSTNRTFVCILNVITRW